MYLPVFLPFLSVAATEHHGVLVRGVYDGLLIRHAALRILHGVGVELQLPDVPQRRPPVSACPPPSSPAEAAPPAWAAAPRPEPECPC